jgi:hypothetical protein
LYLALLPAAAQLSGNFSGSLTTAVNGSNWFDSTNGKVPLSGYGNSNTTGSNIPMAVIPEFGATDGVNTVEVNLTTDGDVTLTIQVTPGSGVLTGYSSLPYTIDIKGDSLKNYKFIQPDTKNANLTIKPVATLSNITLNIKTSAGPVLAGGPNLNTTTYVAKWKLYVSAAPWLQHPDQPRPFGV